MFLEFHFHFHVDAILGFAGDTIAFSTGSERMNAFILLIIMIPILALPNYESIAKISALGTGLIFMIFFIFGVYGLHLNGLQGFHSISIESLWPQSFEAFSNWFGVTVCKSIKRISIQNVCIANSHFTVLKLDLE